MTALPHTRARPGHWLATAAALAAVIGAFTAVQPDDATARTTLSAPSGTAATAPDPRQARLPLDCGAPSSGSEVVDRGAADFDKDEHIETVAVVRCQSETGSAPHAVFVVADSAAGNRPPRVTETLVSPQAGMQVTDFSVRGRTVSATLLGYSSAEVPRCCPDTEREVKWQWQQGQFALTPAPVAQGT